MKTNVRTPSLTTHQGATAKHISPEQQLKRTVMSCLLWENTFYESGSSIVDRIADLVPKVAPIKVSEMAIQARTAMKLRHVPLLLVKEMAKLKLKSSIVSDTIYQVIQRPDEMPELLSLYFGGKKIPIAAQIKKGLADSFDKFNEYSLQKWNQKGAIKLRDVLRLVHPKPKNQEQSDLWKRLKEGTLATPVTWETVLSSTTDKRTKKEKWEGLLKEKKIPAMALLRNLRNFIQEGVEESLVIDALKNIKTERVLPYRFIAAAKYAPQWEPYLEEAMFKCLDGAEKLPGKTVLLVDVSGSMYTGLSQKSDLIRMDAACGLAILARELCEQVDVITFSSGVVRVPARRGFALRDSIQNSQNHGSTMLGLALHAIFGKKDEVFKPASFSNGWGEEKAVKGMGLTPDRLIVITDEQSHDTVPDPKCLGYMINVASYQNGVGYGPWVHIDGFSEAVLQYITELEKLDKAGDK